MSRNARHILWSLHVSESETYTHFGLHLGIHYIYYASSPDIITADGGSLDQFIAAFSPKKFRILTNGSFDPPVFRPFHRGPKASFNIFKIANP